MQLDVSTLVVVHAVMNAILIMALAIQYHITRRFAGMRLWLWGCISLFVGFVLFPARLIPGFSEFSVIFNNFFFVLGWMLIAAGYVRFFNKREPRILMLSGFALYMVAILFFTLVDDSLKTRVFLFSLAWAVLMFGTAIFLFRVHESRLRFMRLVSASVLSAEGTFFLVRALLSSGNSLPEKFFTTDPLQIAMFFVLLVTTILLVTSIIIMVNQRLQVEANEARDNHADLARQREVLMRELQHRVKNNLNMISMFLSIERERSKNDELRDVLAGAIGRVKVISSIYERLYLSSDLTRIDVASWVRDIAGYVRSLARPGTEIRIEAENVPLDSTLAVPLGMILTELLINSVKYAYASGAPGVIQVVCQREMGDLVLKVEDEGTGLPQGFDPEQSSGLGMKLVTSLARQLGGTFAIDGIGGARASLVFPFPRE